MNRESFVVLLAMVCVGALLWGLGEYEKAKDLQSQVISLDAQVNSFDDYLAFNRTYINLNGNGGMFDGNRSMLYVKTNFGNLQSCLIFLHELGHVIQYSNNDSCFYSVDLNACEKQANVFKELNSYRCNGL